MATKSQVSAWIHRIAPIAVREAKKHDNIIFPSVCIAQSCIESGYGTTPKMINANAVFGVKVGSGKKYGTAWKGMAYKTGTTEYYDGKTATKIKDYFRAYDSIEESVEDYFDLVTTLKMYIYAWKQDTPLACIQGLQKAPYATAPTYVRDVMNIINKYNLTAYDEGRRAEEVKLVPILRRGSKGIQVKLLQTKLNLAGDYGLQVDGDFGRKTEAAVRDYQAKHNLEIDGIVGKHTCAMLNSF